MKRKLTLSLLLLLKAGAAMFDEAHLELLKEYCRLHLAQDFGLMLNQEFQEASDAFNQAYFGTSGTLTLEESAAQSVQSMMSDYLSQAYVSRHFSASAKAEVEQMVRDILSVYKDRINALTWMSDVTKAKAIRKLETMTLQIGYPDTWEDTLKDAPILSVAEGGSFFQNTVEIGQAYQRKQVQDQQGSVDKTQWLMTPDTVNACYVLVFNSILFPAAILQPPFYDPDASYEKNLGGIGYVIAHEITHAFDNNGAKYDENGNAADWWTQEDKAAFRALCQQVVALYDGKECAPGITCNGALTLSENIADLGAIACITELAGRQETPDYQALYTAASQIWCTSRTREMKQYLAQNDVHGPEKLRGGLVFAQFEEFYDAFGIREGDGMYLAPADRVTIW